MENYIPSDEELTPGMKQFKAAKERYPDCIIFFRMGDFYELFYNDAVIASRELDITLTKRGAKAKIPLAGIPYHAVDVYLPRLVSKGYKVAICEQIEDPKKAKGLVKRDVIRVVSPGTLMNDSQLMQKSNNFIMSIIKEGQNCGIAVCDLSTGEFKTTRIGFDKLQSEVTKYLPSEILIPESSRDLSKEKLLSILPISSFVNKYPDRFFSFKISYEVLVHHFNVLSLNGFGIENDELCISACGSLLSYLNETQMTTLSHINNIQNYNSEDFMILDRATIKNLELTNNIRDNSQRGTLLEVLDQTKTAMGTRLIRQWLLRPLIKAADIKSRLDAVRSIISTPFLKEELSDILRNVSDIERLISKINYKSANSRDLISLKNSLKMVPLLKNEISKAEIKMFSDYLEHNILSDIIKLIESSIKDEPPLSVREGGMIKDGFNSELDRLRDICLNGKKYILALEEKEKQRTEISSLKVGFNKVFGYFIEVTNKHKDKIPEDYIRKQTRVGSERYITEELKQLESDILSATEKIYEIEYELFMQILDKVHHKTKEIQRVAREIAGIDVILSFAEISSKNNYAEPEISDDFEVLILDGRHPTIELSTAFVPNDCNFSDDVKMKIITGPNMAGKSTYMRQCALIVLMAQIGCFVPAKTAKIGLCDRIFTRIGAYDDLTSGQSTFMIEMTETANILNNATSRSFIVLDEIGRGTSTFDGVSIAWSVAEYIHKNIGAKTLFATHYHVLTKLSDTSGIKNYSVAVKEKNDEIIFLRKIVENALNKSFGIQVAKLAGLPKDVIIRAKEIQNDLESQDKMKKNVEVKTKEQSVQLNLSDL